MGGHVDRFAVRFVLAFTVLAWASVLAHDAVDHDPAESIAPASSQTTNGPSPEVPTVTVPPTNGTPSSRAPPGALFALTRSA